MSRYQLRGACLSPLGVTRALCCVTTPCSSVLILYTHLTGRMFVLLGSDARGTYSQVSLSAHAAISLSMAARHLAASALDTDCAYVVGVAASSRPTPAVTAATT